MASHHAAGVSPMVELSAWLDSRGETSANTATSTVPQRRLLVIRQRSEMAFVTAVDRQTRGATRRS